MLEDSMEIIIPFLKSNVPITMPSKPVVKSRIIDSWILIIVRINTEEKNTARPRGILKKAAIAIGIVLNGLKNSPIAGKNIGADWNRTANVVNMPPTQIKLLIFILFNFNASLYNLVVIFDRKLFYNLMDIKEQFQK